MEYGNYSEFCYVAPVASTTTTTTTSSSFDGLTEADLDFLKRMNMNDREVRELLLRHVALAVRVRDACTCVYTSTSSHV